MYQQLSPQDAQFLYLESGHNLTNLTCVFIYDPSTVPGGRTMRFKDILAHVESRLHMSPLCKRRLVHVPMELDYPYWVDDEHFDLEYHVRHGRLPDPGDWRQFCIHMARYHSRPLDMNRPLWEMYVIEGLDRIAGLARGSYAIATKIHHAAVDGMSIIRFFGAMGDLDEQGTPALSLDSASAFVSAEPSLAKMARRGLFNNLRSPIRMAEAIGRAAPSLVSSVRQTLRGGSSKPKSVPTTRFNGKASPHKMFDATSFELSALKQVRKLAPGCTINDVILTICGGALRRYLQEHGELPEESLVAMVPINARSEGGPQETVGNNITSMTVPIRTDEADPRQRLLRIMQATQSSKAAQSGVSARLMTDLTKHVPAATQVMASRLILSSGVVGRMANLMVSNVPGPQQPLYMNGALQTGFYALAPLSDGMGLFIATPSYNGKIFFNVTSTREILPDIGFFIECLREALSELQGASERSAK